MSLRDRVSLAFAIGRFGVAAAIVVTGAAVGSPAFAAFGVAWALWSEWLLREAVLPLIFRSTTCPGCRRSLPLTARWKCGGHYTDARERHVLAFRCPQGHLVEGFDCPRCSSTIMIQRGDRKVLRHASALKLRSSVAMPPTSETDILVGHDERSREVAVPRYRLDWHMAITGGTGRGKSTLLANMAKQFAENGTGFTLLDPGGDLALAVLRQIPEERRGSVLYLDVGNQERPFPLNVLSGRDAVEQAMLVEELLGAFERLHAASWGPLLAHQLRMALRAVMSTGGTLRDVYDLFIDPAARQRIVAQLQAPELRSFWSVEFPTIPAVRRTAVTNKLAPIVFHPILGPILSARDSALDADRAIAEQRIVIVNLGTGTPADNVTTLLGTFLVQKVLSAAFRQGRLPPPARVPHVLIVDEFQRFMHRAAGFDQVLAEARKFKLSLVVANQFMEQLSDSVRAALFGNIGCLAAFRVGHRDARILTPEFAGAQPEELMELGIGRCFLRIGTDWTAVRTLPPPAPLPVGDRTPNAPRTANVRVLHRPGRPPAAQPAVVRPRMIRRPNDGGELVR